MNSADLNPLPEPPALGFDFLGDREAFNWKEIKPQKKCENSLVPYNQMDWIINIFSVLPGRPEIKLE